MNSAISYLRPHGSQIVIYIYIFFRWSPLSFLLCLSHFRFFPVSPFLYSLSLPLLDVFASKPMVDSQWLSKSQTHCPNHKPMVDLWLPPNQPPTITAAAQGEQPWRPMAGNGPTATHAIWTPPTASHDHHRPTAIWIPCQFEAYKSILRERRSFHYERKRGESVMGLGGLVRAVESK